MELEEVESATSGRSGRAAMVAPVMLGTMMASRGLTSGRTVVTATCFMVATRLVVMDGVGES